MEVSEERFDTSDEGGLATIPLVAMPLVDIPLVDMPFVYVPFVAIPLVAMPLVAIALVIWSDKGAGALAGCSVATYTCVCVVRACECVCGCMLWKHRGASFLSVACVHVYINARTQAHTYTRVHHGMKA
jgi:hypothetical protein